MLRGEETNAKKREKAQGAAQRTHFAREVETSRMEHGLMSFHSTDIWMKDKIRRKEADTLAEYLATHRGMHAVDSPRLQTLINKTNS